MTSGVVIDAAVTLAWLFHEGDRPYPDEVFNALTNEDPPVSVFVPAIWSFEVVNGLLMAARRRRLPSHRVLPLAHAVVAALEAQVDHAGDAFGAVLTLARAHDLTSYDAAYLELAMRRSVSLATMDRALTRAAASSGVLLFGAGS